MLEDQIATKAPENDAAEQITAPVQSTVQLESSSGSTPVMGEHCTTDRPTPAGENPSGELTKIRDIDVYIAKPADYPHTAAKLLLLLTGGTGLLSKNNQLQADKYAAEGFLVVMPDQFSGDPAPNTFSAGSAASSATLAQGQIQTDDDTTPTANTTTETTTATSSNTTQAAATTDPHQPHNRKQSWLESTLQNLKLGVAVVAKSSMIDMWLARHTPSKVLPKLRTVLAGAVEEFADAVAAGDGVYAVGYCFGAKYVMLLGGGVGRARTGGADGNSVDGLDEEIESDDGLDHPEEAPKQPLIKVAAVAHGTQITPEDISRLKVPTALICVEDDPLFPNEVRVEGIAKLEKTGVEHKLEVYPEVPHGFAVYGDYEDAKIKEAQKMAFSQMLAWLKEH